MHFVHPNDINLSSTAGCGVIPVKTGIQSFYTIWTPAFAGVTVRATFRLGDGASAHFILKLMTLKCTMHPDRYFLLYQPGLQPFLLKIVRSHIL